jgi:hypothetical protein
VLDQAADVPWRMCRLASRARYIDNIFYRERITHEIAKDREFIFGIIV